MVPNRPPGTGGRASLWRLSQSPTPHRFRSHLGSSLVHDMDRLSRWPDGLIALRDRLEAKGVTVVSVTGEPAATAP